VANNCFAYGACQPKRLAKFGPPSAIPRNWQHKLWIHQSNPLLFTLAMFPLHRVSQSKELPVNKTQRCWRSRLQYAIYQFYTVLIAPVAVECGRWFGVSNPLFRTQNPRQKKCILPMHKCTCLPIEFSPSVWLLFSILGTSAHQITRSVLPTSTDFNGGSIHLGTLPWGLRLSFPRCAYQTARKTQNSQAPENRNPIEELKCLPWRLGPTPVAFINTKQRVGGINIIFGRIIRPTLPKK